MKNCKILVECWRWSRQRGHIDFKQRQFYPTPVDIKNIVATYKARKRWWQNASSLFGFYVIRPSQLRLTLYVTENKYQFILLFPHMEILLFDITIILYFRYHSDDSVAVDVLCTETMKEQIIYYQPLNE